MTPRPRIGSWSTYTVLGLVGYAIAAIAIGAIGNAIGASLVERVIPIVVPPLGFWTAISIERRITGVESIIFYRTSIAAWALSIAVALATGARIGVVSDFAVLLVAAFLALGRVGCFHVACCHGRPARFGVRYTDAHARLGFPRRLVGRTLFPVQLVEALASALLAVLCAIAILRGASPGTASCIFVASYALVRFPLELLRGDAARPYVARVSEAQWIALGSTLVVAAVAWSPLYAIAAVALALATLVLALRTPKLASALHHPRHLDELERVHRMLAAQREAHPVTTSAGLRVSICKLPAGVDVLWSHEQLREPDVRTLASELALQGEVVPARSDGMFHVVVSSFPPMLAR